MGLFSVAQLAELAQGVTTPGSPETYPLLKIQAPGQTFLWTSKGFGSLTHGVAEERILDWGGEFGPDVDLTLEGLASWEMRITVADMGETEAERRRFAREFATYRNSLVRSAAILYPFASPNLSDADTFSIPLLVGVPQQVAAMIWEIPLRPDDTVLNNGVLQKVPIGIYFTAANQTVAGRYAPIVYGRHDSNGVGGKGMIPCHHVDTVGHRYLISLGRIKTLIAVYSGGMLVPTSSYTLAHETIKGTVFSLIDFAAAQGDNEVAADVEGLTVSGDGSGALITNPVDQWKHAVVQFGYNDWRQGAFFADTTAPIDTASTTAAADYLARANRYVGSMYITGDEQTKIKDFSDRFLEDHPLFGYWSLGAKIALGFIDEIPPATIYPTGSAFIEGDMDEEEGYGTSTEEGLVEKEIGVQYIKNESSGEYGTTLKVADLSVSDEVSSSLQLDWAKRALL